MLQSTKPESIWIGIDLGVENTRVAVAEPTERKETIVEKIDNFPSAFCIDKNGVRQFGNRAFQTKPSSVVFGFWPPPSYKLRIYILWNTHRLSMTFRNYQSQSLDANSVIDGECQKNGLSVWFAERDANGYYALDEGTFSQPEVIAGIKLKAWISIWLTIDFSPTCAHKGNRGEKPENTKARPENRSICNQCFYCCANILWTGTSKDYCTRYAIISRKQFSFAVK